MSAKWKTATLKESKMVANDVMSLTFTTGETIDFKAGQHVDVRLTAPDGYQAERSYSFANAPEQNDIVEIGVQLLPDGEVSPYLFKLNPGKHIEIRGPIGGHFIWDISQQGPLILIGGGSGMVPLMSMLRHHMNNLEKDKNREIVFLISARTQEKILYKDELNQFSEIDLSLKIVQTITDAPPANWTGYNRRIDEAIIKEVLGHLIDTNASTYICGPNSFVSAAAGHMINLGFKPSTIKTERFGGK